MSLSQPQVLRPSSTTPAVVASRFLAITGFVLLAAAAASGVSAGIWATLIVGASVPLRHSVESESHDGAPAVRRRPALLALAVGMATAGSLLGLLLSE